MSVIGHSPEDDDNNERSSSSSDDGNETDDTECINHLEGEIITPMTFILVSVITRSVV